MANDPLAGMLMIGMGGVFSVEIKMDEAGRLYVYQRHDSRWRHSMTYENLDELQDALTSDEIRWLEWNEVS